jgi:putative acetyltransferase
MEIRRATAADVPEMLALHRAAVQKTAALVYSAEILEQWSPGPTPQRINDLTGRMANGEEIVFVAVDNETLTGFGAVVPDQNELRAVYVHPDHGRRGVGGQLLAALEEYAKANGVTELQMDSSLNAEAFYRRHGFEVIDYGEHTLSNGLKMACVKMRKFILRST